MAPELLTSGQGEARSTRCGPKPRARPIRASLAAWKCAIGCLFPIGLCKTSSFACCHWRLGTCVRLVFGFLEGSGCICSLVNPGRRGSSGATDVFHRGKTTCSFLGCSVVEDQVRKKQKKQGDKSPPRGTCLLLIQHSLKPFPFHHYASEASCLVYGYTRFTHPWLIGSVPWEVNRPHNGLYRL